MSYKIVVDSCCDLAPERRADPHFEVVPLILEVDGVSFIDDETFNQAEFLAAAEASRECPRTACPSPGAYVNACSGDADMVFIVTLSRHLSGSCASAEAAKKIYREDYPDEKKKIWVFSSDSACCGESLIAFHIQELAEKGLDFQEIVKDTQHFIEKMKTFFVLEDMDTLKKNGRLTGLTALLVTKLNIRPVCAGEKGVITRVGQTRGMERALRLMADIALKDGEDTSDKVLAITHVACPERAERVKREFLSRAPFRSVYICDAAGVGTVYAGRGEIAAAF